MSKDALLFNKVAGGVIAAGLLAFGLGALSHALYNPQKLEKNAYTISEGGDTTASAAVPVAEEVSVVMISDMMGAADIVKGAKLFKKCASCHTSEQGGADKLGPHLYDIVGRDIGGADGFSYSAAMAEKGGTWGYEELSQFLTKPKDYINGTKMAFGGLKKPADRANLVGYLRTLSANPVPLP